MSATSPEFYSQQYASAVELLAQQRTPRLAQYSTGMTAVGKAATVVNLVDAIEADERTTRYDDIVPGDPAQIRPWVYPRVFDKAVWFDSLDAMRMNANPTSQYTQALVAAINRKIDDEFIAAFFRSRNTGEDGTDADAFDSGKQVGTNIGGTASGMNVEKLQNALQIFRESEVFPEEAMLHCAISPEQERNLMNEIEVTSGDFTAKRILDGGTLNNMVYLGITFHLSNRLGTTGGLRRCPVWSPKGMALCTWDGGLKTDVTQRRDKRGLPWQAYVQGAFGAVRRDADHVVEIQCTEA